MARRFEETLHGGYVQAMDISGDPLVDERSDFQHIQIFDTPVNGRVLALDGIVQLSDRDEASYSEMLVHPPLLEHGAPRRILIVGGGDGAVAEEALKYKDVEGIDLVEIDPRVIEVAREHLQMVHGGAFDDDRLHVVNMDAFKFLRDEADIAGRYDLIVADRPDPVGPAQSLFAKEFYDLVARALSPRGVAVFQSGCPFYQAEELTQTLRMLGDSFQKSGVYLTVTPTYTGGYMALTWGSSQLDFGRTATQDEIAGRFAAAGVECEHYTPALHMAAFALPRWIEELIP
ncbi:MAG: polyamine aminopropyltransferase [Rhodovibrionaceae bacterium]|nr:polyamine aminopropyltransferase [Rhodovibrionaceae bacterium]